MNAISWIILAVVAALLGWALYKTIKNRGKCSGCSGNCKNCKSRKV